MEESLKNLELSIQCFYKDKNALDMYKKLVDEENKDIKQKMFDLDKIEFETSDGLIAKKTIQKRESFIEPNLISYLKENDFSDAIDLVEVVNYDVLEDMIYNGKINASELAEFKDVKEVVTLKVSKKK